VTGGGVGVGGNATSYAARARSGLLVAVPPARRDDVGAVGQPNGSERDNSGWLWPAEC